MDISRFIGIMTRMIRLMLGASVWLCTQGLVLAAALSWQSAEGHRWAALELPKEGRSGFRRLDPGETGLAYTNLLDEWEGAANRVLFNGSGVALGDFDGDGWVDLFVCGLNTPCALYRNLGDWRFEDVTQAAGVALPGKHYRGAVFADLNGDGALDLLVTTTGQGTLVLENDGRGRFRDVTAVAGTASNRGSVTLALADVDGNGTLDLYITNNRRDDIRDRGQVRIGMRGGQLVLPPDLQDRLVLMEGRVHEFGEPDQLMLNDGRGRFTEVSWTQGAFLDEQGEALRAIPRDWGLTATFRDLNGDGAPDLYVCNDYWSPDRIWINNGRGGFRAIDPYAIRHTSASSMGVDIADINHDGHPDIYVLDMLSRDPRLRKRQLLAQRPTLSPMGVNADRPQIMRNTLLLNRGDTTFAEIADYAGIPASDWSWSPVFIDVDLDGFEDLLIPAGHTKDVQDLDADRLIAERQRSYDGYPSDAERQRAFTTDKMLNARLYPPLEMPIVAFRNLDGLRFEEVTHLWGTHEPAVHHGIAMADLDNDGDLDFVVNVQNGLLGVYRNETTLPRIAVRLRGLPPNTQAIGAQLKLLGGAVPVQSREIIAGGRYLSGADTLAVFAAGTPDRSVQLEVTWRSGRRTRLVDLKANRIYEVHESEATDPAPPASRPPPSPWFEDRSLHAGADHIDTEFNDFARQPLLPRKLSRSGPGLAWFDLNGDGWEDLIVGSGKGGRLTVLQADGRGGFGLPTEPQPGDPVTRDQTSVLAFRAPAGAPVVLAGIANYDDGQALGPAVQEHNFRSGQLRNAVPAVQSSTGPLAMADVNGDGQLDLFVGGRVLPGRWPQPCESRLFLGRGTDYVLDTASTHLLQEVGLVSGATFTDLDGDGWPDLVLACEWGPLRVFGNRAGRLEEITEALGLGEHTGWWNSIAAGDLDGDGHMDLVAGNWGLNSPYRVPPTEPLPFYYADFDQDGYHEIIETEWDPARNSIVPSRMKDPLMAVVPYLASRFGSHQAFSEASAEQFLGPFLDQSSKVTVRTLATTVFLRRGDRFQAVPLPPQAQWAPVFGIVVADFDGDGQDDLFLAQNFFATRPDLPRLDAGIGLLLHNRGGARFDPVPGQVSGLVLHGEQRGAAVADYDQDGRVDLAVGQHGAATRIYRNLKASPGLRIRVEGLPPNPHGVGTRLRWIPSQGPSQTREIRLGGGYWSQDSLVATLGRAGVQARLEVMLPGGVEHRFEVPASATGGVVNSTGEVRWLTGRGPSR